MTVRTWLYGRLMDPSLTNLRALVDDRVFAKKSMKSSVEEHPYIVYKMGNKTDDATSETIRPYRQYFQIYVHDYKDGEGGDYTQIDLVLKEIEQALVNQQSPEHEIIQVIYLETSQDLDDETLNTVFRYARFQAIVGKAE